MASPPSPRLAVTSDAGPIAHVHVESWRTTYRGLLPDPMLDEMDAPEHEERWARTLRDPYRRSVVLVAEERGRVVGFASCGHERDGDQDYEGELYAIYLLRESQGRGHGRALVEASAAALELRGLASMVVWVLRDNGPARGFYERLGGVYLRERPLDLVAGVSVPEVSYLWPDTAALIRRARAG
jgi:ribosomal protein S18 acetylase RimI-like enzyme